MNIIEALAEASKRVGAIPRDDVNPQQGFKYRGIDSILKHVQPVFADLGIVVTPIVVDRQVERLTVRSGGEWRLVTLTVDFYFNISPPILDASGEFTTFVKVTTVGEGFDPSDKAANKAMTGAFKYALTQILCLAAADLDDADRDTPPEPVAELEVHPAVQELFDTIKGLPEEQRAWVKEQFEARGLPRVLALKHRSAQWEEAMTVMATVQFSGPSESPEDAEANSDG